MRHAITFSLPMLISIALSAQTPWPPAGGPDDGMLASAVEAEYWADHTLDANAIDLRAQNGIVTLEGRVSSLLARDRAELIAESVAGVRGVINRIEVNSTITGTDEDLRQAVRAALLRDPATDAYELDVVARDGTVTLSGQVDSRQEKELCNEVVRGVFGVRELRNEVAVELAVQRADSEIQPEIERRLAYDVRVDDQLIEVRVDGGQVRLTGVVGSLAEKQQALSDAWVAGVRSVDGGELDIAPWARDRLRRRAVVRTDAELAQAVHDAMLYDPRVLAFEPRVRVVHGVVTLTGVVTNLEAKEAAAADAGNVVGVWRVRNRLRVRPTETLPDGQLEENVLRALAADPYVERFDVAVDANGGWIHLAGQVNNSFERHRAGLVARRVKGVTRVTNNLRFDQVWTWRPDWQIEQDVVDHLRWSPFVDPENVEVVVEDGVVTLRGRVANWSERAVAERNAFQGGAKDVRNKLSVVRRGYGPDHPQYITPTFSRATRWAAMSAGDE